MALSSRLLLLAMLMVSISSFAQISHGGSPVSFSKNLVDPSVYKMPVVDVEPYLEEDQITDQHKDIAWRFGIEQSVNLNLFNSGLWTTLANGDRVWRLKIQSPNATTVNVNYQHFYLPLGATFFVYNESQVLGSFTHQNNKIDSLFSTSLLVGDNVVLEYFEPLTVQGQGTIEVSSVVHGYRDLFDHLEGYDDSGICNVNAVCDTTDWGNEIRASVMILTSGNTRFCSGALVNNTANDGTPYVLTANHCSNINTNNIFMFNYQSPTCASNTDGPTTQTISGCFTRAANAPSDFFLVEMSSAPPANYNVFYAGWSRVNTPPTSATGIHYPRLDVKKISHDTDPLIESGYYTSGNDHWQMLDWNSGTTESGSSGSPLFDQNHRIVGQLHGGYASCSNDGADYYGKFSYSWDTNPAHNKQLKHWLDPANTGSVVLDGYDPNGPNLTTDVALLGITEIEKFICGDSITPKISIRNNGSANLTSLNVAHELDNGGLMTHHWTGNLPPYAVDVIELPTAYITDGTHIFSVNLTDPNATADENPLNSNRTLHFNSTLFPIFTSLTLNTDDYASETSWYVKDTATGVIVATSSGYPDVAGGQTINESVCLYSGCFTFVLKDGFGDGYCCASGNGSMYLIEDSSGDTLVVENSNSFTADSLVLPFCVGINSIRELTTQRFQLFPNPTQGIFTIVRKQNNPANIVVYNMLGKEVLHLTNTTEQEIELDISNFRKGIYLVELSTSQQKTVQRLVVY